MSKQRQDSFLLPFIKAGIIHLMMFGLLFISFQSTSTSMEQPLEIQVMAAPIIKATAVSSEQVKKLVKQKKQRHDAAAKAERDRKQRIKQKAEKKKKAAQEKKRKKAATEKKRKIEAEKKRKVEEEKKRKKAAAEKKRKIEAEKKRKAEEEKRKKQQRETEIQAQLTAKRNAAKEQKILTELQKYVALIKNKISQNWIIGNQTGKCILEVKLIAGGFVIDVREIGGQTAVCRSAKAAVYKADPLPVSKDPDVFEKMRTLRLDLEP